MFILWTQLLVKGYIGSDSFALVFCIVESQQGSEKLNLEVKEICLFFPRFPNNRVRSKGYCGYEILWHGEACGLFYPREWGVNGIDRSDPVVGAKPRDRREGWITTLQKGDLVGHQKGGSRRVAGVGALNGKEVCGSRRLWADGPGKSNGGTKMRLAVEELNEGGFGGTEHRFPESELVEGIRSV